MTPSTTFYHGKPEEAGMIPERVEHIKRLIKNWVDERHTPSLVVLAARKGVIFLNEAFGTLRPSDDSPLLQVDSIFPLMSITKPITATAAMILMVD